MEMQKATVFCSAFNESVDLQTEVLSRLPLEFVYRYRLISKQWNDLLSSNYFLTVWADARLNRNQPRLVLCNKMAKDPWMAFCFYTRTWINCCFNLSFMEDWMPQTRNIITRIHCNQSVPGLILVIRGDSFQGRVCNPYTKAFVDIPAQQMPCFDYIVVDQIHRSDATYNVIAVGANRRYANGVFERQLVQIYEPSQKRWDIAGYIPQDFIMENELVSFHGSFYMHCHTVADETTGIAFFTIPYERDGSSSIAPNPIPMLFAPLPEMVRNWNRDRDLGVLCSPRIITCGSRVLLVAAKWMTVQVEQGEVDRELVIIIWEFLTEECQSHPSNSPLWKWVEIARMPSLLCEEWMKESVKKEYHWNCCTGVGDYVCFVPSIIWLRSTKEVNVVTYDLKRNRWDRLPSLSRGHCSVGGESQYTPFLKPIAFVPNPITSVSR